MKLFFSLIIFAICFFVLEGPSSFSTLMVHAIWDLGHPISFVFITYYLLSKHLHNTSRSIKAFSIFCFTIMLSVLIESIQTQFNRTFDWRDITHNIYGSLLTIFYYYQKRYKKRSLAYGFSLGGIILLVILILIPLYQALKVALYNQQHFPVLLSFSSETEIKKWKGNNIVLINNTIDTSTYYLKATMLAKDRYNPITLKYFSSNWSGFQNIRIEIELDETLPIKICVRITDEKHDLSTQEYKDRYQRCFNFIDKINTINIPLDDIINAPEKRKISLDNMSEITIYSTHLLSDRIIYINKITLI